MVTQVTHSDALCFPTAIITDAGRLQANDDDQGCIVVRLVLAVNVNAWSKILETATHLP
jgi:hypothetical protein